MVALPLLRHGNEAADFGGRVEGPVALELHECGSFGGARLRFASLVALVILELPGLQAVAGAGDKIV